MNRQEIQYEKALFLCSGLYYAQGYYYKIPDTPANILDFLKSLPQSKINNAD